MYICKKCGKTLDYLEKNEGWNGEIYCYECLEILWDAEFVIK
jgi:hypothetical protein